jgi:hypothetical protein
MKTDQIVTTKAVGLPAEVRVGRAALSATQLTSTARRRSEDTAPCLLLLSKPTGIMFAVAIWLALLPGGLA